MLRPLLFIITLSSSHNPLALTLAMTAPADSLNLTKPEYEPPLKSYSFTLLNSCPEYQIFVIYSLGEEKIGKKTYQSEVLGTAMFSLQAIHSSTSSSVTLSYELYSDDQTLLARSAMKLHHQHLNVIGMVSSEVEMASGRQLCHPFRYHPSDSALANKSVILFLNGGVGSREIFIGEDSYGHVAAFSSASNSFLQVTRDQDTSLPSATDIRFCSLPSNGDADSGCFSSLLRDPILIPMGSALLVSHHLSRRHLAVPAHHSSLRGGSVLSSMAQVRVPLVFLAPTGQTNLCGDCANLNDDLIETFFWDVDVAVVVALTALCRSLSLACLLFSGYVVLAFLLEKNKGHQSKERDGGIASAAQAQDSSEVLMTAAMPSTDPARGPEGKVE
jgi:hypothetical protein